MNGFFETKAAIEITPEGEISGIAWPFGTPDRVGDIIVKGAFAGSLGKPIPMLAGHRPDAPIGSWTHVEETDEGLIVKGRILIDDVAAAREQFALWKAGAIGGLSIGFITKSATGRKPFGRTISNLDLVEISLVSVPSHPGARIRSVKTASNAFALADAINRLTLSLSK